MLISSTIKKLGIIFWVNFFVGFCDHTRSDYVPFHKDNFLRGAI